MRKLLILCFVTISFSAFSQEKMDCSAFKNGNFTYIADSTRHLIEVERRGKYQTEKNTVTGEVTKHTIKWTSDCAYRLRQFATNRKGPKKGNGRVTEIVITKTYPDRYEFSCPCPRAEGVTYSSGTMIKVQ